MNDPLDMVFVDDRTAFGVWRNFLVARWRAGGVNSAQLRGFREAQRRVALQSDPVACFQLIDASKTSKLDLTEEDRKNIGTLLTAYNHRQLTVGITLRGEGLVASASRAMVSGIILISRLKYPIKIFDDVDTCGKWVLERCEGRPKTSLSELTRALRTVDAKILTE
ncbi:MAG: hypothetical protein Q8Q09_24665 [Deltaproteobacteria bacterium]|nr:hypothetical protein [Deltaproteobacteria bacterium]